MTTQRAVSLSVFLLLCAIMVVQAVWYYPQLPARVASHFGATGEPNGWMDKSSFMALYMLVIAISALTCLGLSFLLPRIDPSVINLPNKDYWFSPQQKQRTTDFLSWYFLWLGSVTLLLMIDMLRQSVRVNLGKAASLEHPLLSLGLFIGLTVVWVIGIVVRFRKK